MHLRRQSRQKLGSRNQGLPYPLSGEISSWGHGSSRSYSRILGEGAQAVGAPKGRMEGAERGPIPRKHNDDPHSPRHPAFISVADCRSTGGYRPLPPAPRRPPPLQRQGDSGFSHFQEKGGQRLGGEAAECWAHLSARQAERAFDSGDQDRMWVLIYI